MDEVPGSSEQGCGVDSCDFTTVSSTTSDVSPFSTTSPAVGGTLWLFHVHNEHEFSPSDPIDSLVSICNNITTKLSLQCSISYIEENLQAHIHIRFFSQQNL